MYCKNLANKNGLLFEQKTNNELRLINKNWIKFKYGYHSGNIYTNKKITFVKQNNFKKLFIENKICRNPDEAYIIEYNDKVKRKNDIIIIEKKNQNVAGSVDDKLLTGPGFVNYYNLAFNNMYNIKYIYVVNNYLKEKFMNIDNIKFQHIKKYCDEHNINILYGDDDNYFNNLNNIINENFI